MYTNRKFKKNFKIKVILSSIFIFLIFIGLGTKLIYLQVIKYPKLKKILNKQFIRNTEIETPRGNIFDRNGKILAMSIPVNSYFCIPSKVEDIEKTAKYISENFDIKYPDILDKLQKKKSFFWIQRKVSHHKINKTNLPKGINTINEWKRSYPNNEMACHVIGITSLDNQGLSGIEYKWDSYLKMHKFKEEKGRDAMGRKINFDYKIINTDPIYSVYLTIDKIIQYIAEKHAQKLFKKTDAKHVTIIAQNIKTGEILALVNLPNFNANNIEKHHISKNIAVNNIYEPGSTLKIFTLASAIENNLITIHDKIFCENGKFSIYGYTINDHEKYGLLDIYDIIAYSSNIGIAKIADKFTKHQLYNGLASFGFGNYSGIGLPGETKGILRHPKNWTKTSKYVVAFGQEIGVNSIQLISAYSCIANKGVLLEPKIIKYIKDKDDNIVFASDKRIVRKVVSEETSNIIIDAMEKVVEYGTANLIDKKYNIVGKTGTAQKIDPETNKYFTDKYISSFIGFFPKEDPIIAILVMVDEPQGLYWGGILCAPIFESMVKEINSVQ